MNDCPPSGSSRHSLHHVTPDDLVQPTNPFLPFPRETIEGSIPRRFEEQVRRWPGQLAVRTRAHELTYEAFNALANLTARAILSACGEGPQQVALMFEHDAPMLIAIMAVLKAGKTYVPLDPRYPSARLSYMLEDSQASLIVTNGRNKTAAGVLARDGMPLLDIDHLAAGFSPANLDLPVSADAVAYIIYTSGSTGMPKGVPQPHRNVLHEIMNYTNAAHLCRDDRILLVSSCSFADSVRTIFGTLLNGASLFPLNVMEEGLTGLADWLMQSKISVYRSIPTVFRHFCGMLGPEVMFPGIRLVYLAGEPVHKTDVELFKRSFSPDCILVNGLGCTETLTYRWYFLNRETSLSGNNVPVGYALEDMEASLTGVGNEGLGQDGVGEIAVRSRYLSPGYWRNPELTGMKFKRVAEGSEEQIFLTGDLGQLLPDGCLLHMGRVDSQVKIRGYRVEVAEIETLLGALDGIGSAIVASQKTPSGDDCLVGYLVPANDQVKDVESIRGALAEKLPEYMIPSVFMILEALPLLPNGKVDRRALPVPDWNRSRSGTAYVAPRTSLEETLVKIWSEVFGIEEIGVNDNFFDLGGHSLLATRIVSLMRSNLHTELSLQSFFEVPTVAQLSVLLDHDDLRRVASPPIVPRKREISQRGSCPDRRGLK